ncbi:hypothetical protein [Streptomyces sp. WAC06614]|uniref:hypothetical protein n=1 Tax=Streptomyces sp. WAC06614 TaxID=2487416 RepID=UPI000F79CCCB|nr:hypothetical protein [Streptomyces sp. WAC06614]RSS53520.1 hypothetical protein EF918_35165 [Streptomyces sp. WAC06614]
MSDDNDYSATVLGSHWISGGPLPVEDVAPDRVDGSVLRFGPGVTAAAVAPFAVVPGGTLTLPAPAPVRRSRWAGLRRYTLAAVVLLAVLGYLAWQRLGPSVAVRDVTVSTAAGGPTCGAAADVLAVVATDGRPGTLTYRWIRSDGTRSEQLTERVARGQHEARLHLLWTFQGTGSYPARAELELLEPARRTAAVEFTYQCSG